MGPLPVQQRWLVAVLGTALLADLLLFAVVGGPGYALALPGAVALLGSVFLGVARPEVAAFVGAAVLVVSSEVIEGAGVVPRWFGIEGLLLSEGMAGAALMVLVVWRARAGIAVAGVTALVLACLTAVIMRSGGAAPDGRSLTFGFVMLGAGVTAGVYLRRAERRRAGSGLDALVRRQWPLGAALGMLLMFDIGVGGPYREWVALSGAVVASVCAFFGPRAPVRAASGAAAAIAAATLPTLVLAAVQRWAPDGGGFVLVSRLDLVPVSLAQLGATVALVAYAVRWGQPRAAGWSTVALAVANLGPLVEPGRGFRDEYLVPVILLVLVAVAIGLYLRARDRERNQSARVAVTGVRQAERMALARELHDVVAHHVTGIVVQAQAARLVAGRNPAVAVGALEKIENSGTEALVAMRMLVGSLRGAEPAGESTATATATSDLAADLRALVDGFTGPAVHLELILPETLSHELGRTVLRLVQESLTNVSKHAEGSTSVRVGVAVERGDELHLVVADDGTARRGAPAGEAGGYGLIGMRERVELLGGSFDAGPGAEGGWVVTVRLPLRGTR